jgi:hypothetical protein
MFHFYLPKMKDLCEQLNPLSFIYFYFWKIKITYMYFPSCIFNTVSVIDDVTLQFSIIMMKSNFIICVKLLIIKLSMNCPTL